MSYTPKYFNKYGLEFVYFNKYLLYDDRKENVMSTVYHTIYSKHFKLDRNLEESVSSTKQEPKEAKQDKKISEKQEQKALELKEQSDKAKSNKTQKAEFLVKDTKNAVSYWFNYLQDLENQCMEYMGFSLEIKKMRQKSRAFVNVEQEEDEGEIYYIREKYLFLERLYKQYVFNFQSTVNTLYWNNLDNSKALLLAKFIVGGENAIPDLNPGNILQLNDEFFPTENRSNLQLQECMDLAIKMNASYLTEIRKYAEEEYPSAFNLAEQIPVIKKGNVDKPDIEKKKKKHSKKSK